MINDSEHITEKMGHCHSQNKISVKNLGLETTPQLETKVVCCPKLVTMATFYCYSVNYQSGLSRNTFFKICRLLMLNYLEAMMTEKSTIWPQPSFKGFMNLVIVTQCYAQKALLSNPLFGYARRTRIPTLINL